MGLKDGPAVVDDDVMIIDDHGFVLGSTVEFPFLTKLFCFASQTIYFLSFVGS